MVAGSAVAVNHKGFGRRGSGLGVDDLALPDRDPEPEWGREPGVVSNCHVVAHRILLDSFNAGCRKTVPSCRQPALPISHAPTIRGAITPESLDCHCRGMGPNTTQRAKGRRPGQPDCG